MTAETLRGKVVIVTGASRGIGKAIADEVASHGAAVLVTARDAPRLEQTRRAIAERGGKVAAIAVDIRAGQAAERIVGAAINAFGRIDALVNNAQKAKGGTAPFVEHSDADFDIALDTGPRAAFRLMKAVYPHMKAQGGGAIVNFASGAGTTGLPGYATYAAAKEAMRGFSKVAAQEWGPDNIRINMICPLATTENFNARKSPDVIAMLEGGLPLRRVGDAKTDIGGVVAFLIGHDATYLTGQTLFVDGGSDSIR